MKSRKNRPAFEPTPDNLSTLGNTSAPETETAILKRSKQKRKNEFVLILVLLAIILIGFLFVRIQHQKDAFTVDVSVDGRTIATYRLDEEVDTWIDGYQGGRNHLVIHDGYARIEEADCPDKLCVKQGTVSESGESLVCLPNRVVVAIK